MKALEEEILNNAKQYLSDNPDLAERAKSYPGPARYYCFCIPHYKGMAMMMDIFEYDRINKTSIIKYEVEIGDNEYETRVVDIEIK